MLLDFIILLILVYILLSIYSVDLISTKDGTFIIWCIQKFDSDCFPYTKIIKIKLW